MKQKVNNSLTFKTFLITKYFNNLTNLSLEKKLNNEDVELINKVCNLICRGDK